MQTAIKKIITKAVTEMEQETRETRLSGDEFLDALFKKLFPEVPVKAPRVKKEKKTESAPTTDSEAPAKPKKQRAKKSESAPTTDSEAPATPEKVKKPRAKKAKAEAAPAEVVVPTTPEQEIKTIEVPAAPKKAGRPKKEKGPENLAKLTPTQTKKFKEQAGESGDKKAFVAYVNAMTPEEYNSKKLEEHMAAFAKPAASAPVEEEEVDRDCVEVEFEGKTYYVSPEDNKVYAEGEDGVHVFKGYAGMAAFKDMIVPA